MIYQPGFNAREGLVTFPTHLVLSGTVKVLKCFNAREGLVTFPTYFIFRLTDEWLLNFGFNAREGLVTFPTMRLIICAGWQCK